MFLVDTNVVSELRKATSGRADPNVVAWAVAQPVSTLFISAMTIFELELGVQRAERRDATAGGVLRTWLDDEVRPVFTERTYPIDTEVVVAAASLSVPDPMPLADSLIAATALVNNCAIVTRNTADFGGVSGLVLIDPWEYQLAGDEAEQ